MSNVGSVPPRGTPPWLAWLISSVLLPVLASALTAGIFLVPAFTSGLLQELVLGPFPKGTIILITQNDGAACPRGFQNYSSAGMRVNPQPAAGNEQIVAINNDRNTASDTLWPYLCIKT